ncbi:MAG TPA: protein kinase [Candidatus Saccharimonadales bacterium]|nr:protein kinase [Candidatus Saccharimonadales bacterium]
MKDTSSFGPAPGRIGPYPVERELGRGGMGVVYLARDPRLDRLVAIKVLPEEFARDPERLARFEREARLLASLNHPNIAGIHGLEEEAGRRFLVLEYVEGPTLAERLPRGPLSLEDTLEVARQVAAALEAAHESGVVHRDLKPGNIKITSSGEVKVLDFGLAKGGAGSEPPSGLDLSQSPTLTQARTAAGVILGTAAYMSPEQARGRSVDRRADIWAFGCVLYEMLTGRQAFEGETVTDTLAAILKSEPDASSLPASVPPRLRGLLERCLRKDPRTRVRDIGDVRVELEEMLSGKPGPEAGPAAAPPAPPARPRAWLPWGVAGAAAVVAGAAWGVGSLGHPGASSPALTFDLTVPATVITYPGCGPAISPDGRWLAFSASDSAGTQRLFLRALGAREVHAVEGSDGAYYPFWSPDSRTVAFFAQGKLKRVPVEGGTPQAVCDAPDARGGAWNRDNVILFTPAAQGPVCRVPAGGGTPVAVTRVDSARGETSHRFPCFLPDGRHFLFCSVNPDMERQATLMGSLNGGPLRHVLDAGSVAVYEPPGQLLFVRQGAVTVQAFDPGSGRVRGDTRTLIGSTVRSNLGEANFSVSDNGVLVCQTGAPTRERLFWYDRSGRQTGPASGVIPGAGGSVSLSPDGSHLLYVAYSSMGSEPQIMLVDLGSGLATRLSFENFSEQSPTWSPDGKQVYFTSLRSGRYDVYARTLDGSRPERLVFRSPTLLCNIHSCVPDGSQLMLGLPDRAGHLQVWRVPTSGAGRAEPVLQGPFNAGDARVSPDGHWMSYTSDESGRPEVYVTSFPSPGARYRVSSEGGGGAGWTKGGRELVFGSADQHVMAADVSTEGGFRASAPRALFALPRDFHGGDGTPDGARFVVLLPGDTQGPPRITVLAGWQNEDRR